MKKLLLQTGALLIALQMQAATVGDTFSYQNIVYKITADKEVEVSQIPKDALTDAGIIIPAQATDADGNTYTVTAVGEKAASPLARLFLNIPRIELPATMKTVKQQAFYCYTDTVGEIVLNEGLEELGLGAFYLGRTKTLVSIPSTVKTISESSLSLSYASDMKVTYQLPASLDSIGPVAFGYNKCIAFTLAEGNTAFRQQGNFLLSADGKKLYMASYDDQARRLDIPQGVEEIGRYAMRYTLPDTISVPSSVTTINDYAFYVRSTVQPYTIMPEGSITHVASNGLHYLRTSKFTWPEAQTTIPSGALGNVEIGDLTIPATVNTITDDAITGTIDNLIFLSATPPSIVDRQGRPSTDMPVSAYNGSICLVVPEEALEAYKQAGYDAIENVTLRTERRVLYYVGNMVFETDSTGQAFVSSAQPTEGHLTVPSTIDIDGRSVPVYSIARGAFKKFTSSNGVNSFSITLPASITRIEEEAFYSSNLTGVELPENLTYLGEYAFANTKLQTVSIPGSLEAIGEYAFSNCDELTSVTLHEGLKQIGRVAFGDSQNLQSINLPASLETIGQSFIVRTYDLNSLKIGPKVKEMESALYLSNVTDVDLDPANPYFVKDGHAIYTADYSKLIAVEKMKPMDELALDSRCKVIGRGALSACYDIKRFVLNEGLDSIAPNAFTYSEMESIHFPSTLSGIASYAFSHVYMDRLDWPASVKRIKESMFGECHIKDIYVPATVTEIETPAFTWLDSCNVWFEAVEPATIVADGESKHAFFFNFGVVMYVPQGTKQKYLDASYLYRVDDTAVRIEEYTPTSIQLTGQATQPSSASGPAYNMHGQRVSALRPGQIYIIGGRKVAVGH